MKTYSFDLKKVFKKLVFFLILGQIQAWIWIRYSTERIQDPDPDQNGTDSEHWIIQLSSTHSQNSVLQQVFGAST